MRNGPRWSHGRVAQAGVVTGILLAVTLLVLLPGAAAIEEVDGSFRIVGKVKVAGESSTSFPTVLGLVVPELGVGTDFEMDFSAAHLCRISKTFLVVAAQGQPIRVEKSPDRTEDCDGFAQGRLEASLSSDIGGYIGFYPTRMSATVESGNASDAETRLFSTLASNGASGGQTPSEPDETVAYYLNVTQPNVLSNTSGVITGTFSGDVKVRGLNLRVSEANRTRTYTSGTVEPSGPVGERKVSYVVLSVTNARFTIASPTRFQLAASDAHASVERGRIEFSAQSGSIVTDRAAYQPRHGLRDVIEGSFTATLEPEAGEGSLLVSGVMASTSLRRVPSPPGASDGPGVLVAAVVGSAIAGAAAAGALMVRQRH